MIFFVGFGWAKPVPVNPYKLRHGIARGYALVAAAGPASNLVARRAGRGLLARRSAQRHA